MPRPVGSANVYVPGLDGVRALSVLVVVGYHLELPFLPGGFLGVGMFFTLSGYLITSILLRSWRRAGRIDLKEFWIRRARRLVPGVLLLLAVVLASTAIARPESLGSRLSEALAACFYVSNWATIRSGTSYFQRLGSIGPLDHLWSLAIEEQFYILWPIIFSLMLRVFRGRLRWILATVLAGAAGSFALLAVLSSAGFDNTRAYEGTDTRVGGILVGAALALVWTPGRHATKQTRSGRAMIDGAGAVACAVIGWLVVTTDRFDLSLYGGRLVLLTLATAALVAVVVQPDSWIGRLTGIAPLRWIGERSYGIYLWHLPLVAYMPRSFLAKNDIARDIVLFVLTLLIAEVSWKLIEDPIRANGLAGAFRFPIRVGSPAERRSNPEVTAFTAWVFVALFATAVLCTSALVGGGAATAQQLADGAAGAARPLAKPTPPSTPSGLTNAEAVLAAVDPVAVTAVPLVVVRPESSCRSLAHIGDSTSLGLMSPNYLSNEAERVDARYREVGIVDVRTDIAGARSIVETFEGQPNAETAVLDLKVNGFDGCWVFAMGTNEAANYAAGSRIGSSQRIGILMDAAQGAPVVWLTVKSQRNSGPYANAEMQKFNAALLRACAGYPNLRVYDWNAEVQDGWFQDDGIHFTSQGYAERARRIALAVAKAFPAAAPAPSSCLVASE